MNVYDGDNSPFGGFAKQQHRILSTWIPNPIRPSDEARTVIMIVDRPVVLAAELKSAFQRLLSCILCKHLVFSSLSRLSNRMIQTSLTVCQGDFMVVNNEPCYYVWSSLISFPCQGSFVSENSSSSDQHGRRFCSSHHCS
jgi:hypothetical protein